jgi:hypothetical protein
MPDIEYRPAHAADAARLARVLCAQYPHRNYTREYFKWQYFECIHPAQLIGAFLGDEPIGMFGAQKRRTVRGHTCAQRLDLVVQDAFRRTDVFPSLARHIDAYCSDADFSLALPNPTGRRVFERLGWIEVGQLDALAINPSAPIPKQPPAQLVVDKPASRLAFAVDDGILSWRFDRHPMYAYERWSIDERTFAITKVFRHPDSRDPVGDILYVSWDSRRVGELWALLQITLAEFARQAVGMVTMWALPHTPLNKVARAAGFTTLPQSRWLRVTTNSAVSGDIYAFDRWELQQIDCGDIY